jgi:hypothetical protein
MKCFHQVIKNLNHFEKKKNDTQFFAAQQFAQTFNMPNAKIVRYKGFTKVAEVDAVESEPEPENVGTASS